MQKICDIKDIRKIITQWKKDIRILTITPESSEEVVQTLFDLLGLYPLVSMKLTEKSACFRIRKNNNNKNLLKIKDFSYPPNPSRGRCNIEGKPVFYASSELSTALKETNVIKGDRAYLSIWDQIPKDYRAITMWQTSLSGRKEIEKLGREMRNRWVEDKDNYSQRWLSEAYDAICDLIILDGDHLASSIFCHNQIYNRKADAIIYPDQSNRGYMNIAMSKSMADSLKLWRVYDIQLTKYGKNLGMAEFGIARVGHTKNNESIIWEKYNEKKHDISEHPLINISG